MSQSQVTFTDKVSNGGATNSGKFLHSDANELKSIINSNSTDSQQRLSSLELAIDDMVPAIVIDAAERKALTGGIVGATRIIQSDTLGIIWNLVAEDATLDSSWIGQPYTTDPDGDIVINMELADMSGIVPDLNVLGQVNGRVTLGDGVTVGGNDINTTFVSIANKEAAYALTGVAVGTVYKTEDTGQIMEYMGKRNAGTSDVLYIDTDYLFNTLPAGDNPSLTVRGYYHRRPTKNNGDTRPSFVRDDGAILFSANGDVWDLGHNDGGGLYISSEYNPDPTDIVGTSWNNNGGMSNHPQTIAFSDFPEMYPNNWKHDGTILVNDNDEKILLTNLPDDQQVKIVGEGGRIEQLPPSPLPYIKRGFIISSDGNPRSSISDGGNALSGAWFWHEADSYFVRDDGSFYNAYIYHDGSRWQIGYQSCICFQSDPCASTVHPADATGWTAYDAGGGIGQGTIADDGLVKTRACEVYNSPQYKSSGNTLWFAIKNTVYLTVNDAASSGGYDVNGVTVANGAVQGIGWVQVGERVATTKSTILYKLSKVDEDTTFTFGATVMDVVTVGYDFTLPDVLPNGGTVEIKNA